MQSSEPLPATQGAKPASPAGVHPDWTDITFRLATSRLGLFAAYVAALILAITKVKEFTEGLRGFGLPPWSGIALIAAFPLFALLFSTIPSAIDQRRIRRYGEIKVDVRAGYFTLRPREIEEGFERVDQAHEGVYRRSSVAGSFEVFCASRLRFQKSAMWLERSFRISSLITLLNAHAQLVNWRKQRG